MARKPLQKSVETSVLVNSRRRCCICFGVNRNTDIINGQIAHLDKNNSNNSEDNLAFLCFNHHDEYDSSSSQRKNFTIGEVKTFREELYKTIGKAFRQQVHFGEITTPAEDPYAGTWIRIGGSSAEIVLTPLPESMDGQILYYVSGFALWGEERPGGPNMGGLGYVGRMPEDKEIIYPGPTWGQDNEAEILVLVFNRDGSLSAREEHSFGKYGAGVTFDGTYMKAH